MTQVARRFTTAYEAANRSPREKRKGGGLMMQWHLRGASRLRGGWSAEWLWFSVDDGKKAQKRS